MKRKKDFIVSPNVWFGCTPWQQGALVGSMAMKRAVRSIAKKCKKSTKHYMWRPLVDPFVLHGALTHVLVLSSYLFWNIRLTVNWFITNIIATSPDCLFSRFFRLTSQNIPNSAWRVLCDSYYITVWYSNMRWSLSLANVPSCQPGVFHLIRYWAPCAINRHHTSMVYCQKSRSPIIFSMNKTYWTILCSVNSATLRPK